MRTLIRISFGVGSLYFAWWGYRLLSNPFVACSQPGAKIPGRWVMDICQTNGNGTAAIVVFASAVICLLLAVLPKRHRLTA